MTEERGLIIVDSPAVPVEKIKAQVNAIQQVMRDIMTEGTHYGLIPGCGDKPALLKAGAEKICMTFRLIPTYDIEEVPQGAHREYKVVCTLSDPNGNKVGMGMGSCSTLESKYRWRQAQRVCPVCNKETIIRGRDFKNKVPKGWVCWTKLGGCGTNFEDGDAAIESQVVGRVENPDIADQYNTVLKIAKKRALVDATISTTAASDIFTQDIDESIPPTTIDVTPPKPKPQDYKFKYDAEALSAAFPDNEEKKAMWKIVKEQCGGIRSEDGVYVLTLQAVPGWEQFLVPDQKKDLGAVSLEDDEIPADFFEETPKKKGKR